MGGRDSPVKSECGCVGRVHLEVEGALAIALALILTASQELPRHAAPTSALRDAEIEEARLRRLSVQLVDRGGVLRPELDEAEDVSATALSH
tara:strand:+ start:456 stop:731 length:276 start_codon:yes stop_codon:yes gene_type:complete